MQGKGKSIFKGAGEGFQQYYVLKTFPSTLKDEGKGRKKGKGKKKGERGRKKRERGRKKMHRVGNDDLVF